MLDNIENLVHYILKNITVYICMYIHIIQQYIIGNDYITQATCT